MKYTKRILYTIAAAIVLCACDNDYHPYSAGLTGSHDINTRNISLLEKADIATPYKFAFITDTQGALDDTADALEIIKSRGDIDFIIHGGDITDFGLPKEFIWGRDLLESTGLPFLTVIGNHDCLGNGEDTFNYIFGPQNFSLNIGHTHFVGLNTVALEYDYSHPVPDLDFIEADATGVAELNKAEPGRITHTVVVMHSRPYDEQSNNNVAKAFNLYLTGYPGCLCINGHNHSLDISDIFDNGIIYYQCPNIKKRTFFIFTMTDDGYEYETVEF